MGSKPSLFGEGLRKVRTDVKVNYVQWVYECGKNGIPLKSVLECLKLARESTNQLTVNICC